MFFLNQEGAEIINSQLAQIKMESKAHKQKKNLVRTIVIANSNLALLPRLNPRNKKKKQYTFRAN